MHSLSKLALSMVLLTTMSCGSGWSEVNERIPLSITDSITIAGEVSPVITDAFLLEGGGIAVFDYARGTLKTYDREGNIVSCLAGGTGSGAGVHWLFDAAVNAGGGFLLVDLDTQEVIRCSETGERVGSTGHWPVVAPYGITAVNEEVFAGIQLEYLQEDYIVFRINLYGYEDFDPMCRLTSDSITIEDFERQNGSVTHTLETLHLASNGTDMICYSRSSTEDYLVQGFRADGSEIFRVSLPLESTEKTQEEIDEDERIVENITLAGTADINPDRFIVVGIEIDGEGNVWVQRGTESKPVFDVFTNEGEYITTASFPLEGQYWRFSFTGNQALAWKWDPSDGSDTVYLLELPRLETANRQ